MAESIATDIINLSTALEYQEHSVVNRVLLKNPGGTVTLFSFDHGEGLRQHTTTSEAFIILIEGTARVRIAEREHTLGAGDSILLPANIPHAVESISKFKMLLVRILPQIVS